MHVENCEIFFNLSTYQYSNERREVADIARLELDNRLLRWCVTTVLLQIVFLTNVKDAPK